MSARMLPLVLLSIPAGALAAAVTVPFVEAKPASVPASDEALQRATAALGDLARRLDEVERGLVDVRNERASAPASARVSLGEIEGAVESYMQRRLAEADAGGAAPSSASSSPAEAGSVASEPSVDEAFEQLVSGELGDDETQLLWASLGKRGLSDELVGKFEAAVERSPNDPDLRVELGSAYLQKIFEAGGSTPMAGMWAMKADGAFDAALALDDQHWDARFSKAVSYSFWPPALGMQNKAIAQFEVLVEQQQGQPAQPQFAQTYYFLGNMYQQIGNPTKALEVWQQGLALFPESGELKSQVAAAQGQ